MSEMYLYLVTRNKDLQWDYYSDFVVCAPTARKARTFCMEKEWGDEVWIDPKKTTIERIGVASKGLEAGVVVGSFHAG